MNLYIEPTSGVSLNLPGSWEVDFAPHEYAVMIARATEEHLKGLNIVVTVESPPDQLQELETYVSGQIEALEQAYAPNTVVFLGQRTYVTESETVVLAVHSMSGKDSVIASFQLYTINQGVATVITVTAPLALLDTGLALSHHLIESFSPAARLYQYSFYEK